MTARSTLVYLAIVVFVFAALFVGLTAKSWLGLILGLGAIFVVALITVELLASA